MLGKSLYGYIRKRCPTLGPGGKSQIADFQPWWPEVAAGDSAIGETQTEGKTYPALPGEFAGASFDSSRWGDLDVVRDMLGRWGFIVLRGYIPMFMADRALEESLTYFMGVLRSFTHGYAIDEGRSGIDKLQDLPSKVWERRPTNHEIKFGTGPPGLQLDHQTNLVTFVEPGGQAAEKGVQEGWAFVHGSLGVTCTGSHYCLSWIPPAAAGRG